jgi:hypothetical protein
MTRAAVFVCSISLMMLGSFKETSAQRKLKPMTVCEALEARKSITGKTIAVIGLWIATDEGFWLTDECVNKIKSDDYVWGDDISAEADTSSGPEFGENLPVDMVYARNQIERIKRRFKALPSKQLWAVVYGRFETQDELRIAYALDGKTVVPGGYGHLRGSPAQLIYREKAKREDIMFIR